MTRQRRGVTLVETLVIVAISVLLVLVVYKLFMSATGRGAETTEELALLGDTRLMVENMARDVAAAHVILPPANGENKDDCLTVARYASEDAGDRADLNTHNKVYPFFEEKTATTVKMNLLRVTYKFDRTKRQVTRTEEKGVLEGKPAAGSTSLTDMRTVSSFNFVLAGDPAQVKLVGRNVKEFRLSYMHYDDKGQAKLARDAAECYKTAAVALYVLAIQDQGLYERPAGRDPTRRQPKVEMATKFWSQRKLSEALYPEYFSSVDDDLRF
jgi:type II secretory pathway pseudopilin PulG